MFPEHQMRLLALHKALDEARNSLEIIAMYVHDGDATPEALKPWVRRLDAGLTRLEMAAQVAETFNHEILAMHVQEIRQRMTLINATAVHPTLIEGLEYDEREPILWFIGQLVANPPLERTRRLDQLLAAIDMVRKEIESGMKS
jgi:hypothetical protein